MSNDDIVSFFIEDLEVGQSASYERAISDADVREFALMSGDTNPVHLDEAYAQTTRFKGRIVHGMLPVTFVSTVLGTKLPGAGAIFMGASFRFKAPVRIGDTVVATPEMRVPSGVSPDGNAEGLLQDVSSNNQLLDFRCTLTDSAEF